VATAAQFDALFAPRGVAVVGAATHPGKFGFVALHNLRVNGFPGPIWGTNPRQESVLGAPTHPSIAELPDGPLDLVLACTPAVTIPEVLRQSAARGAATVYVASAGYAEAGDEGRVRQDELVALAEDLGILLVGPNGQGVISTPASLCAQIVAPMPPPGRIAVASQSGGFVSSFANLARSSGVGLSRGVSVGNAAMVGVVDFCEYFARDDRTDVAIVYAETIDTSEATARRLEQVSRRIPVIMLRGGRTEPGRDATRVHTGARPPSSAAFDRLARDAGLIVVSGVEEAWEVAATFATQPLPAGPRTVVFTTAGGWGVVTADAVVESDLQLVPLPVDLRQALDAELPPRWSRANPIDLAGSETRDTIPSLMEIIVGHRDVDAVLYLGLGIQSNQAAMARSGGLHPEFGLDRIVDYHERQDARFATAAAETSDRFATPVLTATELGSTNPENAGPATVRATGRLCYSSGDRAVRALAHLWRYARWLAAGE
jgi:acetyltransferase